VGDLDLRRYNIKVHTICIIVCINCSVICIIICIIICTMIICTVASESLRVQRPQLVEARRRTIAKGLCACLSGDDGGGSPAGERSHEVEAMLQE
jgi:hypothetical protein